MERPVFGSHFLLIELADQGRNHPAGLRASVRARQGYPRPAEHTGQGNGRIDVLDSENTIKQITNSNCLLLDSNVSFKNLDLNKNLKFKIKN